MGDFWVIEGLECGVGDFVEVVWGDVCGYVDCDVD